MFVTLKYILKRMWFFLFIDSIFCQENLCIKLSRESSVHTVDFFPLLHCWHIVTPICSVAPAKCVQPNLPCVDNVAFDMDRIPRSQTSSQRTALVDLSNETTISLEPLRHSGTSQVTSDGEVTPRTGEINIAVTSKTQTQPHTRTHTLANSCTCSPVPLSYFHLPT